MQNNLLYNETKREVDKEKNGLEERKKVGKG
jgi:hypothetical protein